MSVQEVRELAVKTLNELGFAEAKASSENLLIKDGCYLGCRFRFEGISVIWLEEAGLLKFIDDAGKLRKVVRLAASRECPVAERAA